MKYATTFSSYMQYLDVTQHHSYMALGKVLPLSTSLKKFKSSKHFQMQAKVFRAATPTPKDIKAAGEQKLVDIYSGNPKDQTLSATSVL